MICTWTFDLLSLKQRELRSSHFPSRYFHSIPGVEPVQVQETVENHLKSLLIKHFDPRKADSIFTEEGEVRNFPFLYPSSQNTLLIPHYTGAWHAVMKELGDWGLKSGWETQLLNRLLNAPAWGGRASLGSTTRPQMTSPALGLLPPAQGTAAEARSPGLFCDCWHNVTFTQARARLLTLLFVCLLSDPCLA